MRHKLSKAGLVNKVDLPCAKDLDVTRSIPFLTDGELQMHMHLANQSQCGGHIPTRGFTSPLKADSDTGKSPAVSGLSANCRQCLVSMTG